MNFNVVRLRPIAVQLERIADALEVIVREHYGINLREPKTDTSGEEPIALYTDEAADFEREWRERAGIPPKGGDAE